MSTKIVETNVRKFAEGKCQICGKPVYKDEVGSTCKAHEGKVGLFYKSAPPNVEDNQEFIRIKILCDHSQELGSTRGFAVRLTGGDAGTKEPSAPVFQVFILGKKKFVKKTALKALENLLKK